jgi:hypothetical protein
MVRPRLVEMTSVVALAPIEKRRVPAGVTPRGGKCRSYHSILRSGDGGPVRQGTLADSNPQPDPQVSLPHMRQQLDTYEPDCKSRTAHSTPGDL